MTAEPTEAVLQHLSQGEINITGRFTYGSNFTFLAEVTYEGELHKAVYKPSEGERPLWDFPQGTLAAREVAAFEVDRLLDWGYVPATVLREDGPSGGGSLQQFVNLNGARHYFELGENEKDILQPVALFDALINNADRKGGHVLLTPEGKLWLIDHGVCFHHQPKLRTVIWDFAGDPIPDGLLETLEQFMAQLDREQPRARLARLLSERELSALAARGEHLLVEGKFPEPPPGRRAHPWPLV